MLIIVTGAGGLLGINFVLAALERQQEVVALYHQHRVDIPGVKCLQANLSDLLATQDLVQSLRPAWIVHCAALTNVDWCEEHPQETWQVNVQATRWLAKAAREAGAGFVFISTDSVFDGRGGNYSEQAIPFPLNQYARSKLDGEQAVLKELGSSLIVRTNIYGWNTQDKLSLAEWILGQLETNQPTPGFSDVVFTPILVNDLSNVILDMMEQHLDGLYHVAGSESCSKYDFALNVADIFGLNKSLVQPVPVASSALRAPRPRNTSLSTAKIALVQGSSMPNLKAGLGRLKTLRDSGFRRYLKTIKGA